jgi:predicted glycoside hydrolase/deacetylase ChbG (UPF0249 family)
MAPPTTDTSADLQDPMTRLVIHVDDVGMCHGANTAFVELSRTGAVSAGSVMVPCPWSSEILEVAAADGSLDLGVHLTLNAEQQHYRWRPVGRHPDSAGLVDDDGYMWRRVADVRAHAHPDAVESEWRLQIERALSAGVDVTHLDAHMGSALAPEWCQQYVALGVDYEIPVLITGSLDDYGPRNHLADVTNQMFAEFVDAATAAGLPVFTRVLETDFARARHTAADYRGLLGRGVANATLVFAALHPCAPGPGEIEVIEPDQHHVRTDEYAAFSDPAWVHWLETQHRNGAFEVVTMRELRDEYRARLPAGR